MPDLRAAKRDLAAFAEMVGRPLADWQAEALRLEARITAIVAPRQSGKSRSLGVLSLWWAFRRRNQRVLVVSASEEASRRVLADIRAIVAGCPLLAGSVVDERAALVTLSNGSEIRSVPASEKQVRGWSVDLLLIDEAGLVSADLILGAAFPTTAARPDARIVLAGSASEASGPFYEHVLTGRQGAQHVRSFAWPLGKATWISAATIEAARASMSPLRFAAEYEGVFASAADALFPRHLLDAATADIVIPGWPLPASARGLLGGVDWGFTTDRSAIVALARLQHPAGVWVIACSHGWRSGHPVTGPGSVVQEIVACRAHFEFLHAEANGVGAAPARDLQRMVRGTGRGSQVVLSTTSAESKAVAYAAVRTAFEQGRLVLPASAVDLRRELELLRVTLTQTSERIEASVGHDDVADAVMLAAGPWRPGEGAVYRTRLGDHLERSVVEPWEPGDGAETTTTGAGLVVPRVPGLFAPRARRGATHLTSGREVDPEASWVTRGGF